MPVRILLFSCLLFGAANDVSGEEAETEKARAAQALELMLEGAGRYDFKLQADPDAKVVLKRTPVLRWSNPVAGSIHGNVFLWTSRGRPVVVGSLYKWFEPFTHASHEFHSLSTDRVSGERDQQTVWRANAGGVEFAVVPGATKPAGTAARRLSQMRLMARQFLALKTDREKVTRQLRRLSQPIYRYESDNADLLDGALFAFVQGTDPEVFLLLEARRKGQGHRWEFALARMNSVRFEVRHKEQRVWEVDILPWSTVRDRRQTYANFRAD